MGRRRSPQYPCGVCNANCNPEDWSVFCDSCQSWFHDHCENLSASQMNELAGSDEDFLCTSCTHVDGRFDFTASISRLGKAADCGIAKLRAAIQAESTFLRRFESNFPTSAVNLESRKIDEVASKYLQKMTGSRVMQPCAVSADGNCLFNALSVAVTGDEAATSQIRVLTAIEMMTFGQEYVPQLTSRDIHLVSPDYEEACLACAKSGSYSSAWTIQAAASVLKRDIMSTYPPVNGLFDVVCKILDTIFRPRSPARPKLAPVHIMWTNVMPERSTGTWTPNHFVPLLPSTFPDVVDLDKPNTPPKKSKTIDEKPVETSVTLSPEQKQKIEENRLKAVEKLTTKSTGDLQSSIGPSWFKALETEFSKPYFIQLSKFVSTERSKGTIFPPADEVFSWTKACSISQVKVVILGQDPYHGVGQAHGLCFSVKKGVAPPPSLVNMYKELEKDIEGFKRPEHGTLTGWAHQGVLLLNAVLTVRAHNANSHKDKGWEKFTDAVIRCLNNTQNDVVFMLWGSYAQKKGACIDKKKHHVLKAVHPSPLSAHRGFFGCKHFSQANEYLLSKGKKPIDWTDLP